MGLAKRTVCKQAPGLSKTAGPSEGAAGFNLETAMLLQGDSEEPGLFWFFVLMFTIHQKTEKTKCIEN